MLAVFGFCFAGCKWLKGSKDFTYLTFGFWWKKASASPWMCFHLHKIQPAPCGKEIKLCLKYLFFKTYFMCSGRKWLYDTVTPKIFCHLITLYYDNAMIIIHLKISHNYFFLIFIQNILCIVLCNIHKAIP